MYLRLSALLLFFLALVASCNSRSEAEQSVPLRLGLHTTRSIAAFWVAEEKGYFTEEGVDLKVSLYESALDRDRAFHDKAIDCMVTDLVGAALLKGRGEKLRIVSPIVPGGLNEGRLAILASPHSSIKRPIDLKGKRIGLSFNTIVDFATDKLLEEAGLSAQMVQKVSEPMIQQRLSRLLDGTLDAAILPEPLATTAQLKGAKVILDDHRNEYIHCVLAVQEKSITKQKRDIEKMLVAVRRAAKEIRRDQNLYRQALLALGNAPKECEEALRIVNGPKWDASVEDQVREVVIWLKNKNAIKKDVSYPSLIEKDIRR